jgi:CheY-like chemotaxis protein
MPVAAEQRPDSVTSQSKKKTAEVLAVEDNAGDVDLLREGFKRKGLAVNLTVLSDGEDVLPFLRRQQAFESAAVPDLILLDLNLPGKDGREVLAEIKSDPELRRIPVVVLTASESPEDIARSYDAHANCYLAKPVDLRSYLELIGAVQEFWLVHAKLPEQ